MNTNDAGMGRRRRRKHSESFKAEAVAACRQPGVSIAAVAMARSINANLLRRWVVEGERAAVAVPARSVSTEVPSERFVAVTLPSVSCDPTPIQIEIRRGAMTLSVQWPRSAMAECALWLREILK